MSQCLDPLPRGCGCRAVDEAAVRDQLARLPKRQGRAEYAGWQQSAPFVISQHYVDRFEAVSDRIPTVKHRLEPLRYNYSFASVGSIAAAISPVPGGETVVGPLFYYPDWLIEAILIHEDRHRQIAEQRWNETMKAHGLDLNIYGWNKFRQEMLGTPDVVKAYLAYFAIREAPFRNVLEELEAQVADITYVEATVEPSRPITLLERTGYLDWKIRVLTRYLQILSQRVKEEGRLPKESLALVSTALCTRDALMRERAHLLQDQQSATELIQAVEVDFEKSAARVYKESLHANGVPLTGNEERLALQCIWTELVVLTRLVNAIGQHQPGLKARVAAIRDKQHALSAEIVDRLNPMEFHVGYQPFDEHAMQLTVRQRVIEQPTGFESDFLGWHGRLDVNELGGSIALGGGGTAETYVSLLQRKLQLGVGARVDIALAGDAAGNNLAAILSGNVYGALRVHIVDVTQRAALNLYAKAVLVGLEAVWPLSGTPESNESHAKGREPYLEIGAILALF